MRSAYTAAYNATQRLGLQWFVSICILAIAPAGLLAQFGGPPAPPTTGNPGYYGQPYAQPPVQSPAQPPLIPGPMNQPMPPLNQPWVIDPNLNPAGAPPFGYDPAVRNAPIDVYVSEGQTGRVSFGGSVNSDLGVAGQLIIEERNFDIFKLPGRPSDLFNGAFRGAGQNFRLELVPGNQVQRYTMNWTEPNLFGYSPFSLSVGGFYFTRFYRDWSEQRLGGRAALGYDITPDLSVSTELRRRCQDVQPQGPRRRRARTSAREQRFVHR